MTSNQWKEKSLFLGKNKELEDAELWAIFKGLEVASQVLNEGNAPVTIFSDSQKALRELQHTNAHNKNRFLKNLINQKANKLQ